MMVIAIDCVAFHFFALIMHFPTQYLFPRVFEIHCR